MHDPGEMAERFLALHHGDGPLLMANVWDQGSAALLASLGFAALATTSSGHAASLGRLDYGVSRDEALGHAAELCTAVDLPVSADLEDCFPHQPGGVAETIRRAAAAGLAGCSIEDWDQTGETLLGVERAAELVALAAEQAHAPGARLVLTARAENHIRGNPDLDDTITRLQAYAAAGADVLYAPGLRSVEEIRAVCAAVSKPVNVLALGGLSLAEIVDAGAQRVSVGGGLTWVAVKAMADAATAIRDAGDLSALTARVPLGDWFAR
jgi:2-methylisocitrate lyase-like PEP mutase family enzyme